MRYCSLLLLSLGLSSLALAQTETPSSVTEAAALYEIDTICADSWCAGDFNYRFDALTLDEEGATLSFALFPWGIPSEAVQGTCSVPEYTSYEQMVSADGFLYGDFYSELSACLNAAENKFEF